MRLTLALLFAASALGAAEPKAEDLGQGLGYLRVAEVPAQLPLSQDKSPFKALVLDLRGSKGDAEAAGAFAAWLGFRGPSDRPLLVLANRATSPALLQPLLDRSWPGLITLAPEASSCAADLRVAASAEEDSRACEQLAAGAAPASLLLQAPAKVRDDEEALMKGAAEEPEEHRPDAVLKSRAAPTDRVLTRAVELHRALLALGLLRG